MSGVLAPIGIVSAPMAQQFGLELTAMTSRFSWLTVGILIGAALAVPLLQSVLLRHAMLGVYLLSAVALFTIGQPQSVVVLQVLLGLVGVASGIGLAAAASVISRSYTDRARASALVVTDGFFSIAGIVCAALASYLVAHSLGWFWVYVFVGAVALLLVGLASFSEFPEMTIDDVQANREQGAWPWSAWCCLSALGLYTLAQSCILLWLPQFAQQTFGMADGVAGSLIGRFWSGMFIGQMIVALVVMGLGVNTMLWLAVSGALLGSVGIWLLGSEQWLGLIVLLWGLGNLGLLKLVISLAAELTRTPSPRLLSSLLFGATAGTAIGPAVSSFIVARGEVVSSLQFGSGLYLFVFLLIAIVLRSVKMPRVGSA